MFNRKYVTVGELRMMLATLPADMPVASLSYGSSVGVDLHQGLPQVRKAYYIADVNAPADAYLARTVVRPMFDHLGKIESIDVLVY